MALIGRAEDLAAIRASIASGHRLVTILGPAGMGKTSLAREIAGPEACFVDLTGATTVSDLAVETARALGLSGALEPDAIARALAARGRVLLVLDNLEQLLPGAAPIVAGWVRAAPQLYVVATSREVLKASGEVVREIAPLPEALELFLTRARERDPTYASRPDDLAIVARVVERLERIPLAIELAAARASVLSPAELAARLEDRFAVLAAGPRDRAPRQATMRGAIEWSWALLDPREQRGLACAATFRGSFELAALEAVVGDEAIEVAQSLRDKSLVRRDPDGRLGLYEIIREFARGKLDEAAMLEIERAHARWFVSNPERENLEAALAHAADRADPELDVLGLSAAAILDSLAGDDGITATSAAHLDTLLARRTSPAAILARAGRLSTIGHYDEAEHAIALAEVQAEKLGDGATAARAKLRRAGVAFGLGRIEEAIADAERAKALFHKLQDALGEAEALAREAAALSSLGRGDQGLERYERARGLARSHKDARIELGAEAGIAFRSLELERHDAAEKQYQRCLDLAARTGAKRMSALVQGHLGLLELDRGRWLEALEHAAIAVAALRERGESRSEGMFSAIEAAARASLDEVAGAEEGFFGAGELLARYPFFLRVAEIHRGHLDLAKARQALAVEGDLAGWAQLKRAARARLDANKDAGDRSDDARVALRILARAIEDAGPEASDMAAPGHELELGPDAAWFAIDGGTRVSLERRAAPRRVLAALCTGRETHPGEPLAIDVLLDAGWPDEKLIKSAALNRLHVALAALRSLGLKDAIDRKGDGYRIPRRVRLSRT